MPSRVAIILCWVFVGWLFMVLRDRKARESKSLWVPLVWLAILMSRPLSSWLQGGSDDQAKDGYPEGSPVDRTFFLALIAVGVGILRQRHTALRVFIGRNKWLFIYFLYLGISVLWSDDSFVSLKRWIKDVGNIVMVLIVLTETKPTEAIKTLLLRCAILMVPFSIVLTKYVPDLGRYYNRWTGEATDRGVATDKNMLGATILVCVIGLLWSLIELRPLQKASRNWKKISAQAILLVGGLWMLGKTRSSTSLACAILAVLILFGSRMKAVREKVVKRIVPAMILILCFGLLFSETLVASFGRDMTFTGRTEIWKRCLAMDINPILGVGYYSFWSGARPEKVSEGFFYKLNEAHNGYIETYLNSGILGVILLGVVIIFGLKRTSEEVVSGRNYGAVRLSLLVATMIYNFTEASFNRMSPIWFVLLLAVVSYPSLSKAPAKSRVPLNPKKIPANPPNSIPLGGKQFSAKGIS